MCGWHVTFAQTEWWLLKSLAKFSWWLMANKKLSSEKKKSCNGSAAFHFASACRWHFRTHKAFTSCLTTVTMALLLISYLCRVSVRLSVDLRKIFCLLSSPQTNQPNGITHLQSTSFRLKKIVDYLLTMLLGRLSEELSRVYAAQIAVGLQYCHQIKVMHRDLKPQNILIAQDKTLRIVRQRCALNLLNDFR